VEGIPPPETVAASAAFNIMIHRSSAASSSYRHAHFVYLTLSSHCTPIHSSRNATSPTTAQFFEHTPRMIVPHSIPASKSIYSPSSNASMSPGTSCNSNTLSKPQFSHRGIPCTAPALLCGTMKRGAIVSVPD